MVHLQSLCVMNNEPISIQLNPYTYTWIFLARQWQRYRCTKGQYHCKHYTNKTSTCSDPPTHCNSHVRKADYTLPGSGVPGKVSRSGMAMLLYRRGPRRERTVCGVEIVIKLISFKSKVTRGAHERSQLSSNKYRYFYGRARRASCVS